MKLKLWQVKRMPSEDELSKHYLSFFQEVAGRVPAYKDFLKRHKIRPQTITTMEDFKKLPRIDKENYIWKYELPDLCWDGEVTSVNKLISTSSGSTGIPQFWPRGNEQTMSANLFFKEIFEGIFSSEEGSTLFINSFALGTWIAGLEFYNAVSWVADQKSKILIATPGIEKAEAFNQVSTLKQVTNRIIFAGYPPFVKDVLDYGIETGIVWEKLDIRLLVAGEAISERWRDRVLEMIGRSGEPERIINVYGMAETGVVAHETPFSINVRRALAEKQEKELVDESQISGMYQYYPLMRHFEEGHDTEKSILLTTNSGLPLIRYNTRDSGGIIDFDTAKGVTKDIDSRAAKKWNLPLLYLHGRKDLSIQLYAVNIYVENLKKIFESAPFSRKFSGLFSMSVDNTRAFDQKFSVVIEQARTAQIPENFARTVVKYTVQELRKMNTEFNRLYQEIGRRADPRIKLVPYGKIETIPGRKHKWIKRR